MNSNGPNGRNPPPGPPTQKPPGPNIPIGRAPPPGPPAQTLPASNSRIPPPALTQTGPNGPNGRGPPGPSPTLPGGRPSLNLTFSNSTRTPISGKTIGLMVGLGVGGLLLLAGVAAAGYWWWKKRKEEGDVEAGKKKAGVSGGVSGGGDSAGGNKKFERISEIRTMSESELSSFLDELLQKMGSVELDAVFVNKYTIPILSATFARGKLSNDLQQKLLDVVKEIADKCSPSILSSSPDGGRLMQQIQTGIDQSNLQQYPSVRQLIGAPDGDGEKEKEDITDREDDEKEETAEDKDGGEKSGGGGGAKIDEDGGKKEEEEGGSGKKDDEAKTKEDEDKMKEDKERRKKEREARRKERGGTTDDSAGKRERRKEESGGKKEESGGGRKRTRGHSRTRTQDEKRKAQSSADKSRSRSHSSSHSTSSGTITEIARNASKWIQSANLTTDPHQKKLRLYVDNMGKQLKDGEQDVLSLSPYIDFLFLAMDKCLEVLRKNRKTEKRYPVMALVHMLLGKIAVQSGPDVGAKLLYEKNLTALLKRTADEKLLAAYADYRKFTQGDTKKLSELLDTIVKNMAKKRAGVVTPKTLSNEINSSSHRRSKKKN